VDPAAGPEEVVLAAAEAAEVRAAVERLPEGVGRAEPPSVGTSPAPTTSKNSATPSTVTRTPGTYSRDLRSSVSGHSHRGSGLEARGLLMPRWTVSVKGVLIWDDKVALVHNERDEWELPGGQLEDNEAPEDCVVREIAEELAIVAEAVALLDVWVYEVSPGQKVLIVTFGCVADQPSSLAHSEEHDGAILAPINALNSLRIPDGYRTSILSWRDRRYSQGTTFP
jgi:8-oxo-dGTP pyrophosphatase MutT (NUDIX family)